MLYYVFVGKRFQLTSTSIALHHADGLAEAEPDRSGPDPPAAERFDAVAGQGARPAHRVSGQGAHQGLVCIMHFMHSYILTADAQYAGW